VSASCAGLGRGQWEALRVRASSKYQKKKVRLFKDYLPWPWEGEWRAATLERAAWQACSQLREHAVVEAGVRHGLDLASKRYCTSRRLECRDVVDFCHVMQLSLKVVRTTTGPKSTLSVVASPPSLRRCRSRGGFIPVVHAASPSQLIRSLFVCPSPSWTAPNLGSRPLNLAFSLALDSEHPFVRGDQGEFHASNLDLFG
jgi:hypothetical protein